MARWRVAYWLRRDKTRTQHLTEPAREYGVAQADADRVSKSSRVVTILRDGEGADHPANAGKFFLDMIVK